MKHPRPAATCYLVALTAAASAGAGASWAAPARAQQPPAAGERGYSGQDFAGQRFTQAPVRGVIKLAASRAFVWKSGDARRFLLSGDVRISLSQYSFAAKHAAVWLQRMSPTGGVGGQPEIYQVFVALDQVGNAADPSAFGMTAERLPVKAVIELEGKVELTCDAMFESPPHTATKGSKATEAEAAFATESEAMLASSLRRLAGVDTREAVLPPAPFVRPMMIDPATIAAVPAPVVPPPTLSGLKPPAVVPPPPPTVAGAKPPVPPQPGPRAVPVATVPPAVTPAPAPTSPTPPLPPSTGPQTTPAVPPPTPTAPTGVSQTPLPPIAGPPAAKPTASNPAAPAAAAPQTIFAKEGIITLSAKDITAVSGVDENAVIAAGGVVIQYNDAKSGGVLQLTAQRAVVFTNPGKLADTAQFTMENVRGIFLEGEVIASDGKYTLRGPQIYYDVKANRAVMLDAVFWTYDERRKLPLYVRAKSIRQTASDQFEAKSATFTNTAFFDPELSIGASTVTISRKTVPVEQSPLDRGATPQTVTATEVNARNVTLQVAGLPVFYWPWYSGDPANTPIRDFRFENFSGSGGAVKAVINAYSLLGLKTPDDLVFDFLTDYYFERGIGVGTRLAWKYPDSKGSLFAYTVPFDTGTDILKSGANLTHDNEFRGIIAGEQRWRVDDKWTVFAEGAAISDETFIDAFYENLGETRREFTNRLRADRTDRNTQATLEAKASFSDFISNEWLLQSRGYSVNKLPEAMYVRQADDLLSQTHPGLLSYWSEYRVGAISIAFDEIRPENRGYSTPGFASRAFGLAPNQSYADALRTRGYFEDTVYRADTRQELSLNMNAGPVKLTPFVVGRVTAYDNDFKQFSPDEDDSARLYGAAGIRASTTFQRVYDGVDSQLLDIHRLRHIVEPNITVWGAGTTIDGQDLPVYDDSVESLADGMIMRFGATQTFQTQRGAPGRWHNVDLLTLSTDFVVSSGSSQAKTPIGRFFDYRPEYSNPGNYFVGDGVYRLTDTLAFTGSTVYDFDRAQQAMSSTGFIVQHGLEFSTSVDLRYINALDSTYVNFGAQYQFTNKYSVSATAAYDLDAGGFQTNLFEVRRTFASMVFGLSVGYNDITGESSFGFVFRPFGAAGEARVSSGEQGADFGG